MGLNLANFELCIRCMCMPVGGLGGAILRCVGKGALLHCCFIICLHLTFRGNTVVRIYIVYFVALF